jgi:Helix-turn-helix domain
VRSNLHHADRSCKTHLPFAALPHALVADRRLSATMVRLAAILLRYAKSTASCWPSVATLALDLGRCRRTVQYALRGLEAAGWILTRPADNPTGRVIILVWRDAPRCTPPVQTVGAGPPSAVAPESEKTKTKETPIGLPSEGQPTARKKIDNPPAPSPVRTEAEARAHYAGWLERDPGDALRLIAERRVRELAAGLPALPPAESSRASTAGRSGISPLRGPAVPVASVLGGRGPRLPALPRAHGLAGEPSKGLDVPTADGPSGKLSGSLRASAVEPLEVWPSGR